eukprot:CAMPEP_0204825598 /NCGR_PEP_ID=MMETSP1346-20131115/3450_1 /ASSEMBLY_ACC=CAM_ASM_000771 /TAXON_ID=215587 /ORGANISM="Aplanochytrium stocchinoi, Strain GSBS06" /LENGTH=614 /DNA_ID=CAMNT_0051953275 /DNA_START=167 /DNA_END=2011 /DNA_ORIENTATION=-
MISAKYSRVPAEENDGWNEEQETEDGDEDGDFEKENSRGGKLKSTCGKVSAFAGISKPYTVLVWISTLLFSLYVGVQIGKAGANSSNVAYRTSDDNSKQFHPTPVGNGKLSSTNYDNVDVALPQSQGIKIHGEYEIKDSDSDNDVYSDNKNDDSEFPSDDEIMMASSNTPSNSLNSDCEGRRVFLQRLPAMFNWKLCDLLFKEDATTYDYTCPQIDAFRPARLPKDQFPPSMLPFHDYLFDSSQFDVNSIINYRIEHSECRVFSREEADLVYNQVFLAPFAFAYWGNRFGIRGNKLVIQAMFEYLYHVMRTGQTPLPESVDILRRDVRAIQDDVKVITQLPDSKEWGRCNGCDHFMINSRISHDFHHFLHVAGGREEAFNHTEWDNVKFFAVEGSFIETEWPHFQGIPYPGHVHPSSLQSFNQLKTLLEERKRPYVMSMVMARRKNRNANINRCKEFPDVCYFMKCSVRKDDPCSKGAAFLLEVMANSRFCYEPHGDSPTRQGYFDAISMGCIPVVPDNTSFIGYNTHLPDASEYTIIAKTFDSAIEQITQMGEEGYQKMFTKLLEVVPRVLYAQQDADFDDSVTVLMKNLGCKVAKEKAEFQGIENYRLPSYC